MKKKLNERGLPSVGGVSPGDTSNNLGQARRPWSLTGSSGGHSQSADSGFSSKLGRVNKGRDDDKYAYQVRFPENEEEPEEDEYDMSIRSKLSIDLRGRKPMPERKLTKDIDILISENEEFQVMLEDDRPGGISKTLNTLKSVFTDVSLDFLSQIVGTAIPVVVDSARVVSNLSQLETNIINGNELISRYHNNNAVDTLSGKYYGEVDDVIDDIVTDLSDVVEAALSVVPVVGDAAGYGATLASWSRSIAALGARFTGRGAATRGVLASAAIRNFATSILPTDLTSLDAGFDNKTSMSTAFPEAIHTAGTLSDILINFDKAYSVADGNYEQLSTDERIAVWRALLNNQELKYVAKNHLGELPDEYTAEISESKIRSLISQILSESENTDKEERKNLIDEDIIETEDGSEVEEHSIGGYTGPMASPANPREFNKTMQKVSFPD